MDFATAPRGELVKLIYQQQERIDVLGTELARLQELLKQRGIGGNQPSNWKKPNPEFVKTNVKKTKKKKKRMGRERGFARTREKADEQIFHTVDACPDCGSSWLGKPVVWYIKQILDLPIFNYWVVDHVVCKRWCYRCKKHAVPTVGRSNERQVEIAILANPIVFQTSVPVGNQPRRIGRVVSSDSPYG